jgi:hypothetical protein
MKAQQLQSLNDLTLSSDQARRRAMAENLVRSWPRDRAWSFGFAWRWAVENHFDPKSFQDLLRRVGVEQGFGTDAQREAAHNLIKTVPSCRSDALFRQRARAIGETHDLPRGAIDEAVNNRLALQSRVP